MMKQLCFFFFKIDMIFSFEAVFPRSKVASLIISLILLHYDPYRGKTSGSEVK